MSPLPAATHHFLIHRGTRIAWCRQGKGRRVILIHGTGFSGRDWFGTDTRLAEEEGLEVITPDNLGQGDTDTPLPPYFVPRMADDIAAILRHPDGGASSGPALVIGYSLGGMIAQELALRHPNLVSGLILAATTCGLPHGRLPSPASVTTVIRSVVLDREISEKSGLYRIIAHPASLARDPHLLDPVYEALNRPSMVRRSTAVMGQVSSVLFHSTGFRLQRLHIPVEVVAGDSDGLIPTVNAHVLARRIPGARLTIVPQASHVFPLEDPEVMPRLVRRILEVIQGSGVHLG